ncbi:MAG: hypothetical protein AAGI11_11980, partial [Pseudomonadota bacterium]
LISLVGVTEFVNLPTADIGSFLEGAFAPLAFLWLVIGHFMQQKEITANTQAIHFQQETARQRELLAQRDNYFKLAELVQEQLGSIAAFHYMSVCGPTGTGEISAEQFNEMRSQRSDSAWFTRRMIGLVAEHRDQPEKLNEIFFGTDVRKRHSGNFERTFTKLMKAARAVDYDEMLEDALLNGSASGILYRVIRAIQGDTSIDPIFGLAIESRPDVISATGDDSAVQPSSA